MHGFVRRLKTFCTSAFAGSSFMGACAITKRM
jgi:hypothetical protein